VIAYMDPFVLKIGVLTYRLEGPKLVLNKTHAGLTITISETMPDVGTLLFSVATGSGAPTYTLEFIIGPTTLRKMINALSGGLIQLPDASSMGLFGPLFSLIFDIQINRVEATVQFGNGPINIVCIGDVTILGIKIRGTFFLSFNPTKYLFLLEIDGRAFSSIVVPGAPAITDLLSALGSVVSGCAVELGYSSFEIGFSEIDLLGIPQYLDGSNGGIMALKGAPPQFLMQYVSQLFSPGTPFYCLVDFLLSPPIPVGSFTFHGQIRLSLAVEFGECAIGFGDFKIHGFDFYIKGDLSTLTVTAGMGLNYLQIGSGDNELRVKGDFELGLTNTPQLSVTIAADAYAYRPVSSGSKYWMNPLFVSDLFGIITPLAVSISLRVDIVQAGVAAADWQIAAAGISAAVGSMGALAVTAATEVATAIYASSLVIVPGTFDVIGGMVSPAGLRPRYPSSAGD